MFSSTLLLLWKTTDRKKKVYMKTELVKSVCTQAALWNNRCFTSLRWFLVFTLWRNKNNPSRSSSLISVVLDRKQRQPLVLIMERLKHVNNNLFVDVSRSHRNIFRGLLVLCPDQSPFSLSSKTFWQNGPPNLTGNVNDLYIAYIQYIYCNLSKSVCSDAMARVGLCFWIAT